MVRIEFNSRGFDELKTSPGADAVVKKHADELAARANAVPSTTEPAATEPYYTAYEAGDQHRARYRVVTSGIRAIAHEAKTNALQRSL